MESTKQKSYVLPIIMMFALFFMIAFVTGLQNPMGIIVKNQFGASNFMSQLGNAANFIAYAFMGLPAGIMLQRLGYKKTSLAAIMVGFVGVLISYISGVVESFGVYLIGAFISGFSMCMLNTVVNPMLNTLGGGGNRGNQLVQFGGSCNSIGATIVPVLVGYLIGGQVDTASISDANPALFLAMGIFALAFIVFVFVRIPEPHLAAAAEMKKEKDKHSPFSFRHFVLGTLAIFFYVGVEVGIANTSNLFMTESMDKGGLGIDTTIAGTIVGTYWFLMLIGRLIGGVIGSRVSSRVMLTTVCSVAALFILLAIFSPLTTTVNMPVFKSDISFGLAEVPIGVMFMILCGLCTSVMWGNIFNLAVEGLGKYTAAASGIFMVMVCGGGILPLIQGYVADGFGFLNSFWVIIVALAYMLFYAQIGSKNVNKDIPVD
ncbi:MAG TPA: MFS transporter [Candidatus Alistipes merdigallinarum]|nr:MFS transporter [Candidatus Alistipes merdigallinarum]